jgi:hypothetical protein
MEIITKNNDNTNVTYTFDPEHKSDIIGFYVKAYWESSIQGFVAKLNGEIIATVGSN